MARHHFPGFPAFLDAAAEQIGRPEAARPARQVGGLSALANLCAQAAVADASHVDGILEKAAEFRDQLHAAYLAADLMLADVRAGRRTADPETSIDRPKPPAEPTRRAGARAAFPTP